nr:unnamed protein product [Digitaria exilis]
MEATPAEMELEAMCPAPHRAPRSRRPALLFSPLLLAPAEAPARRRADGGSNVGNGRTDTSGGSSSNSPQLDGA